MIRYDQYWTELTILKDAAPVLPTEISKMRVGFGSVVKTYPSDEIKYEDNIWKVFLSQEETSTLTNHSAFQVGVEFLDGSIINSEEQCLPVGGSIFKKVME